MSYVRAYLHNKRFLVVKTHNKEHSTYNVQLLKCNGMVAKKQVKGLTDRIYLTAGDAHHNIRHWDLTT